MSWGHCVLHEGLNYRFDEYHKYTDDMDFKKIEDKNCV